MHSYVVDRAAVEAEVARRRTIHDTGYARWFAAKLGMSLVAFYAVAFLLRFLPDSRPMSTMPTWNIVVFFVIPAFMAGFVTWISSRTLFRSEALNAEHLSTEISKEMQRLTGPGWPLRTFLAGAALAAGVAIPIIALMLIGGMQLGLPALDSPSAMASFVASLLLWALLMAFLIRWASLFLYRKMVRRAA